MSQPFHHQDFTHILQKLSLDPGYSELNFYPFLDFICHFNHTKHRSNVFIYIEDKHLLTGNRKEMRNTSLFAEHFLNPYTVMRPRAGEKEEDRTELRKRHFPKELKI